MKQEIATHLSTLKDEIYKITHSLYDLPEESFKEHNTVDLISKLLINNNFDVTKNYMDIPTAFYAKLGEGHPKICFLCEYDADAKDGHIYGNNLSASISLAAAISLSKSITKIAGSIILIGTPGELKGGSRITMHKQGAFSDLDAILVAKPHIYNMDNAKCPAVIPLKIIFFEDSNLKYTPTDNYFMVITFLSQIMKGFDDSCSIQDLSIKKSELNITIKACTIEIASQIRTKIETLTNYIENLTSLRHEVTLSNLPCSEITKNDTLNRLFAHNLKECGIIDMETATCNSTPSSLGCISKTIPCLSAYVSIVENTEIDYPSKAFAKETLSNYAEKIAFNTAQALAFTGIDLIEKQTLLLESKSELLSK